MKINVYDRFEFKCQVESANDPRLDNTDKSAVQLAIDFDDCITLGEVIAVPAHLDR